VIKKKIKYIVTPVDLEIWQSEITNLDDLCEVNAVSVQLQFKKGKNYLIYHIFLCVQVEKRA